MKQLKRFPDYYITEDAKIVSKRCKKEKFLSLSIDKFGYYCVSLRTPDNKTKSERIHRLMIETYGTLPPEDMIDPTVDHVNGNKLDNHIDNLQWLSNKDNSFKASRNSLGRYTIQDKSGNIFVVTNLTKWTRENNLDKSSLLRSYHKGWWCNNYKIIAKQV